MQLKISRTAQIVFPLAALFNSFSMSALLLAIGIAGLPHLAADIGLVQGATLALFYAFSANARNLILADDSGVAARRLLQSRLFLMLPLAGAAYVLSAGLGTASGPLAAVLILRRMSEWIGEIALARQERMDQATLALQSLVAEWISFLFCLILTLAFGMDLTTSAIPWALVPLVAAWRTKIFGSGLDSHIPLRSLLPHLGSTMIIGTSVYVFRVSIVLLAGKLIAGELFTAFAIGGIIPAVFGQAMAPSLMYRLGNQALPKWLLAVPVALLFIGGSVVGLAVNDPARLATLGHPSIFWVAVGISTGGGAVMSIAAMLRSKLIQKGARWSVFGSDLLSNLLIVTSVPFVFHMLGSKSLAGLYGLSACINLVFLRGAEYGRGLRIRHRELILFGIAALLVAPVFFQISGGLFRDPAPTFESSGVISRLPLPLSIVALFGGIALLSNYAAAVRSLTVVFFTALLFVMTSIAAAQGDFAQGSVKLTLLAQYLLPMFGLVLGEMFSAATPKPIFERAALWMLVLIIPAQFIASWFQGYTLLGPRVFVFSIYQHQQYFPMIVVALAILVTFPLWDTRWRDHFSLKILIPLLPMYILASISSSATVTIGIFLVGFLVYAFHVRKAARSAMFVVGLAVILAAAYSPLIFKGFSAKLAADQQRSSSAPVSVTERFEHWRFYADGVVESPRSFFLGHAAPPDRQQHPSAHNYWLDALYNFGVLSILPMISLLGWTMLMLWGRRASILITPLLLGAAIATIYLVLGENMLKVGMRQPYPGIITFFIWGLLVQRLSRGPLEPEEGSS